MTDTPTSTAAEGQVGRVHKLKTWPPYFASVRDGAKTFELRRDDRDFKEGDTLILQEWDPERHDFTGEQETRTITYLLRGGSFGLIPGHVIAALASPAPSSADAGLREAAEEVVRALQHGPALREAALCAATKKLEAALVSTPRSAHGGGLTADVEALAGWFCTEADPDLDPVHGARWPEHENDDGRREGGFVRLQPSDVQARAREQARRLLRFLAARTPPPAQGAAEAVAPDAEAPLREALEPFAEAARLAIVGGRPPGEFVDAACWERASAALTAPDAEGPLRGGTYKGVWWEIDRAPVNESVLIDADGRVGEAIRFSLDTGWFWAGEWPVSGEPRFWTRMPDAHPLSARDAPEPSVGGAGLTLRTPDGRVWRCSYPDQSKWAETWDTDGISGEQDWELVEAYGLTALFDAFAAARRSGAGGEVGAADLSEALVALAHMQRAAAGDGKGLKIADDVLIKHGFELAAHALEPDGNGGFAVRASTAPEGLEALIRQTCRDHFVSKGHSEAIASEVMIEVNRAAARQARASSDGGA